MNKRFFNGLALILAIFPAVALAHTGQGNHGFADGFAHPFLGMDHLLAMVVVGMWSVLHTRKVWFAPTCFVIMLTIGAILGQHGFMVPKLEPLVAISVLVLGAMLTHPLKFGVSASLALIGGFAVFHGMAHGGELSAGANVLVGIVAGSVLLHVAGMSIAHTVLTNRPQLARGFGKLVTVLGGWLILSNVLG